MLPDSARSQIETEIDSLARRATRGAFHLRVHAKHGSWLNLVEGFFSKLARSMLRHIRVTSKKELKDRSIAAIDNLNRDPVVHTWTHAMI